MKIGPQCMYLSGIRPSVCLSICPSVHLSHPAAANRCCSQQISIDCCTAGDPAVSSSRATARRAAANVQGSGTLLADVES